MAAKKEKCGGSCNSVVGCWLLAVGHEGYEKRNKGKFFFYKRLRERCCATEGDGVCAVAAASYEFRIRDYGKNREVTDDVVTED